MCTLESSDALLAGLTELGLSARSVPGLERSPWRRDWDLTVIRLLAIAEQENPVGLVVTERLARSPLPFRLAAAGRARGVQVDVLPGVSVLDSVLVDLQHDIADSDLQLYDAT